MSKRRKTVLPTIEVHDVTTRHKRECESCGSIPEEQRLVFTFGSGRWAKSQAYCKGCAASALLGLQEKLNIVASLMGFNLQEEGEEEND